MKLQLLYIALIAALSSPLSSNASAAPGVRNDATAIPSAKISLIQAISVAEKHVAGKASRAEFEKYHGQWVVDVEVVSGKKVTDVKVDSKSGKVLAATEDAIDHDDQNDKVD